MSGLRDSCGRRSDQPAQTLPASAAARPRRLTRPGGDGPGNSGRRMPPRSSGLQQSGARMAVPLRTKHELVGVLLLRAPPVHVRTSRLREKQLLSSAADVFALLIENARLNERALEQEKTAARPGSGGGSAEATAAGTAAAAARPQPSRRSRWQRGPSGAITTTSSIWPVTGSASRWPISPAKGSRRRCSCRRCRHRCAC